MRGYDVSARSPLGGRGMSGPHSGGDSAFSAVGIFGSGEEAWMGRDPRDSNRERSGSNQAGERNAATRTPPRGTPPRMGASAPRRPEGRPPSDPRPGRPGNGNGYSNGAGGGSSRNGGNGNGGSYRRPVAGGPDDGGDSRRSGAYSATGARGPRSVPGSGDSGRSPASMPGRNGDANGATPPRRRSMADLARDASRSMSRQLSSVVSRTGHAIRHDGPPPERRGPRTPAPGSTGARSEERRVGKEWRTRACRYP